MLFIFSLPRLFSSTETWCTSVRVLLLLAPAIAPLLKDWGTVATSPRGELPPLTTCPLPRLVASEEQAATHSSILTFATSAGTRLKAQFKTYNLQNKQQIESGQRATSYGGSRSDGVQVEESLKLALFFPPTF